MTFYQLAITDTNASVVAVLFSCNPAFVMVFAALLLHEAVRRRNVAAIILEIMALSSLSIHSMYRSAFRNRIYSAVRPLPLRFTAYRQRKCAKYGGVAVTCMSFLFGAFELLAFAGISHPGLCRHYGGKRPWRIADIPFFTGYSMENIGFVLYIFIGITGAGFASILRRWKKPPRTAPR